MCSLTGIHALVWMKTVMCLTVVILYNILIYMFGRKLFPDRPGKLMLFFFSAAVMLFFFGSIYTPAQFLVTRSYEGKAILGNVVLPALLYLVFIITAGGNVFQMLAVELTSARDAALIFFLKPMLAPLLAWLLIGEAITPNMGAGIVLFLIGSAVALWG